MEPLRGSWHGGGFYGHERSKLRNNVANDYRKLATPLPPIVFKKRYQCPVTEHLFSKHDSRQRITSGSIYIENDLKRRGNSCYGNLYSNRYKEDFLWWMPDLPKESERKAGTVPLSSYSLDYRVDPVDPLQLNERLVTHLRGYNESSTRRKSGPNSSLANRKDSTNKPDDCTISDLNWHPQEHQVNSTDKLLLKRSNEAKESVATCLVWHPAVQTHAKNQSVQTDTLELTNDANSLTNATVLLEEQ